MDNGQPSQRNNWTTGPEAKGQPFFTPGEGIQVPDSNPDLSNSLQGDAFNLDPRIFGEKAINSKIIDFESHNQQESKLNGTPDISNTPTKKSNVLDFPGDNLDSDEVTMENFAPPKTKEYLDEEGKQAVTGLVKKFEDGAKDPATFCREAREMAKGYLKRYYGKDTKWGTEGAA